MRSRALLPLAAAAATGLGAWALVVEPRWVRVRRLQVRLPGWPVPLDGLRVALVADLHAGAPHVGERFVRRLAARVRREHADLVALLGDYVDPEVLLGERVEPAAVAEWVGPLTAPLGAFAVLGNHDWLDDGPAVQQALHDLGARIVEDGAAPVYGAAAPLWVVGVSDPSTREPDPEGALARVPAEATVLALSHDPDVFPRLRDPRVALVLSGHTHGAQVDLPGLRDRVIPSRFGARYKSGHIVEEGRHLYVSRGIGTSRWPVRLNARPEVVVLTLRSGAEEKRHGSAGRH